MRWLEWARKSLAPLFRVTPGSACEDLAPLGKMIGDAKAVAFGEDIHCAAEPLEFRNRLFQYLVQEQGFTAIAIESGIVESRILHDYVRGSAGDRDAVLAQGISWTFDRLPQNRALIEWLREYNADSRHARKINFYGFDVPGSPGNPQANRGVETALTEALGYLGRVDENSAALFRAPDVASHHRLAEAERDALTALIADVIALLERKETQYIGASSLHDYAWAYRAALGARQIDSWLRELPIGWQPTDDITQFSGEQISAISAAADVRDRAQADNLDWIIKREGPAGKILIFAHWAHLSCASVKVSWPNGEEREQQVAGTYLRRRLGDRLLMIGNLIGEGQVKCGDYVETLKRASPDSIRGLAGSVGVPLYLLDLRTAPDAVSSRLREEDCLGHGRFGFKTALGQAFDILYYIDTVTPACV